jgi:hypothetical protein
MDLRVSKYQEDVENYVIYTPHQILLGESNRGDWDGWNKELRMQKLEQHMKL